MSKLMLFATAALMFGSTVAEAQEQVRQRPGDNTPSGGATTRPVSPTPPERPQIQPPRPGDGGPQIQPPRPGNGGPQIQPPRPPAEGGPQIQLPRPGNGGPQIQPPRPGDGGPQIQPPRPGDGGPQIQPPRPGNGGPQIPPPRPGNGGPQIQPPRPGMGGNWNRPHVVAPRYRYPHGYRYHRWHIGLFLPSIFLTSAYYYNDYALLGFGPLLHNYRWVRYGPDLLLVHRRTGRIRDVRYGVFGEAPDVSLPVMRVTTGSSAAPAPPRTRRAARRA